MQMTSLTLTPLRSYTEPTWRDVLEGWKAGDPAYWPVPGGPSMWHTHPAVEVSTLDSMYEQDFVANEQLASYQARLDESPSKLWRPFANLMEGAREGDILVFRSPSGTLLIVPFSARFRFVDVYTFMRDAPTVQKRKLWREVALAVEEEVAGGHSVRVVTHGLQVPWLHVRLERVGARKDPPMYSWVRWK